MTISRQEAEDKLVNIIYKFAGDDDYSRLAMLRDLKEVLEASLTAAPTVPSDRCMENFMDHETCKINEVCRICINASRTPAPSQNAERLVDEYTTAFIELRWCPDEDVIGYRKRFDDARSRLLALCTERELVEAAKEALALLQTTTACFGLGVCKHYTECICPDGECHIISNLQAALPKEDR